MLSLLTTAFLPGVIRIGHTRISVFGFFAAAGLIAAIWLSQYTARLAGVSPQKLWDAGVFLVVSAFVLSRLLLIAQDFQAFLHYPLIVLSLPSLTYGGMAFTAVATLLYIRFTHMPLLATLDAWSPCAALLAAVLALAHFVEGTDAGMPTTLPWGVVTPGDSVMGRVHPVQIYAMIVALLLGAYLLLRLSMPHVAGHVAAIALVFGGLAAFVLNMLMQPAESQGNALLDPGQYLALASILLGIGLLQIPQPKVQELS
jgi:phosphatidylglycerol:prolipoprotein diacylglycerol transferase